MNKYKIVLIFLISIMALGCTSAAYKHASWQQNDYAVVEVFYATDRDIEDRSKVKSYFGSGRGELTYGTTNVSIPRDHKMGELESPSIWRFEFREAAEKHVVLLDVNQLERKQYFRKLSDKINATDEKNAFIYIHGYNVTFEDAARRSAQMSYDLGFNGMPVFYSWPSYGSKTKYTFDEVNIKWSQANVKTFLTEFIEKSGADNIYLIAHSMGNRALIRAYIDVMTSNPSLSTKIKEVILAAPDIDAEIFKRDIAPALANAGSPVTLYASSKDVALKASKAVHAGYPRAGDSGSNILIMPGIETIDATAVKTSFLGHSYYANNRSVISDMFYIIHKGFRANQRSGLKQVSHEKNQYWVFRK
ncbi:alpha/beta hydrolase [Colwelliaceae bacterium MEBiC 14330]